MCYSDGSSQADASTNWSISLCIASIVDNGESLEVYNISVNIWKFDIVSRHAYWDQEELFDKKPTMRNLLALLL